MANLQSTIDQAWENRAQLSPTSVSAEVREAVNETINQLDQGTLRVAEKINGAWTIHQWAKKAVLLSFRLQDNAVLKDGYSQYFDKVDSKFKGMSAADFHRAGYRVVPPAGEAPFSSQQALMDRAAPRTELDITEPGYKYHMNNVNAVIGHVQLENIAPVIARHIANGKWMDAHLGGIDGLRLCHWDKQAEPSYWFYTVLADKRDDLIKALADRGIGCSLAHKRNDLHSVFRSSRRELPGVDDFYSRMLHIPCGWWVSDEDREYIVDTLRRGW